MKAWLFFLLAICVSTVTRADNIIPRSPDTVIATWPVITSAKMREAKTAARLQPEDPQAVIRLANLYLAEAALPGQSRHYGLAHAALEPLINQQGHNPQKMHSFHTQLWLAWAQIQQHQHHFDTALTALQNVFEQEPNNIAANLLAARIYLIQENPAAARAACLKLLGNADLLTVSTCALEVASLQGELPQSYQQLSRLLEREGFPADERAPWMAQVLADMALRMENPQLAAQWLNPEPGRSSVNYWTQWADIQLILEQPEMVLLTLEPVVQTTPDIDDALLLRLALAEKKLAVGKLGEGKLAGEKYSNNPWQTQLHARVNLREQRRDSLHASDLARYYLDINANAERALHWAQINWQDAREYSDKKLLQRAVQFSQAQAQPASRNQQQLQDIQ